MTDGCDEGEFHPPFIIRKYNIIEPSFRFSSEEKAIKENLNCLIMGMVSGITKLYPNFFRPLFIGDIGFGGYIENGEHIESNGYISTKSSQDKWVYNGRFIGENGRVNIQLRSEPEVFEVYIGVKGFRGFLFGDILGNKQIFTGIFIGNADSIIIKAV